ncbi:hypothetical protein SR1949_54090 [Sphaerospermopsis reniformis]|uniref:Uncharacterized protein n=1 Tax=Sphaerospermopsis reniformis TaxID=531300 RepID=A0A480A957_9CYAN|nr:hypothetical protein SR1949_54090 [Sphaerospermopsis reniformis]
MVVILLFNDVVPPALVSKLVAVTWLNAVVPVLLAIIFANAVVLPIACANVKFPAPALTVKLKLASVSSL